MTESGQLPSRHTWILAGLLPLLIVVVVLSWRGATIERDSQSSVHVEQATPSALSGVFSYGVKITNNSKEKYTLSNMRRFFPADIPGRQDVAFLDSTGAVRKEGEIFAPLVVPPYGQQHVQVKFRLAWYERDHWPASSTKAARSDVSWALPQAELLVGEDKLQTVQNIYTWIAENIDRSGYTAGRRGAKAAYETRQGDCTEHAELVVALAEGVGIPARVISGFHVRNRSGRIKPGQRHDWAELYWDGSWHVVDTHAKQFDPPVGTYIALAPDITRGTTIPDIEFSHL